jgi:hypothetical protein
MLFLSLKNYSAINRYAAMFYSFVATAVIKLQCRHLCMEVTWIPPLISTTYHQTKRHIFFGVVSQFMHEPRARHWHVVDHVLQYLKVTPGRGLLFKRSGCLTMKAYTKALLCRLCGNLSLVNYDQAKFRAITQGICELLWMNVVMYCMNMKAL